MRVFPVFLALSVLAACTDNLTPAEETALDERDIALVEKANRGTALPIAPQPILFPDIERYKLYEVTCAFVGKSGGLGAIMLARADDGYMKLNDKMIRFAADKGSAELPYGAHARYTGKKYAFTLALAPGSSRRSGTETTDYKGDLTVEDGKGNVVFKDAGSVQCGS